MYKKKTCMKGGVALLLAAAFHYSSSAQLTVSAQLRTRTELRDGQGAPLPENAKPALFTSQRTRLGLLYNTYRLKLGITLQDARVWGQDVSTINRTTTADNNGLMLHEAWVEILLSDTALKNQSFSLKIGRQELVYDDQRLIGNLDWLQQARRHDAAVLKYEHNKWMLHAGAAFNQNKENATGTVYTPVPPGNYTASTNGGAMYKSLEFLYAGRKLKKGNASFLLFSDQFSKYHTDSSVKVYQAGTWSRITTGFYFNNLYNKTGITASAYYQFGNNAGGQKLKAALLSGFVQYYVTKTFSAGAGIDYTTGGNTGSVSNSFDPLYGTPHKFWGLMDYFYAASPFGKGGLTDYYFKAKLKPSDKYWLTADVHQFSSAAAVIVPAEPENKKKSFGQELDLTATYNITKQISLEGGYSHFFNTSLLTSPNVKNVPNAKTGANWAYLMINIKPEFLFK
jgi:hypothetical protein